MSKLFCLPTQRGVDGYGSGAYGAPRGSRKHKGLDLRIGIGEEVYAPRDGKIKQTVGVPYSAQTMEHQHYKYVSLVDANGFEHVLMYIKASQGLKKGMRVKAGDVIGYAQGLQLLYPGISEHVHYQVDYKGKYFHPLDFEGMAKYLKKIKEGKL
jgi:murein DD-endopeptidase MepM/ murein hydrolase activator NlpD